LEKRSVLSYILIKGRKFNFPDGEVQHVTVATGQTKGSDMALQFNAPLTVKIREGIRVNIALSVSHAIEKDLPQKKLKTDVQKEVRAGTLKRALADDDYETTGTADTISFWFIGGTSLSYRVGHEITQEDFNRIEFQLGILEFRTKNDRIASDNKTDKATK